MVRKLYQHAEQKEGNVFLPKIETLKKRSDFLKVAKFGYFFRTSCIMVQFLPSDMIRVRFGFTVTKRIHKKAVLRNFAKRRLREVCRKYPLVLKGDLVLIATSKTVSIPFDDLCFFYHSIISKILKL